MTTISKLTLALLVTLGVSSPSYGITSDARVETKQLENKEILHSSIRAAEFKVKISTLNKMLDKEYKGFDEIFSRLKKRNTNR